MIALARTLKPIILWAVYLLLFIGLLLGSLQWAGYLGSIANGIPVGYSVAVLIWLSSIFSLIAALFLVLLFILHSRGISFVAVISKRKKVTALLLVIVVAFLLAIQYGTSLLLPIERGVAEGVAPPALIEISSVISLFSILGALILIGQGPKVDNRLLNTNGGSLQTGPSFASSNERSAANEMLSKQTVSAPQPQKEPVSNPQVSSTKQEPAPALAATTQAKVEDEVIKKVSEIVSPNDLSILTSQSSSLSQSERDALQTRKNIAEWIILSLNIGGKTPKGRLEMAFEEQFPKVYVPLFNSVLYDLIYQGKVESTKEGNRMMISLPKEEQK